MATDSLESRDRDDDHSFSRALKPLTTLREEYTYALPPRANRGCHFATPRVFQDVLPAILEEDSPHRLKFTQAQHEFPYGE